jgi:hypothetical protein
MTANHGSASALDASKLDRDIEHGAGIVMESWPYSASRLAWLEESGPAGVICTVMDGLYLLFFRTIPSALAGVAQLQAAYGIFSCCYIVNVHNRPSWLKSGMAARGQLSMLRAPWTWEPTPVVYNLSRPHLSSYSNSSRLSLVSTAHF